MKRLPLVVWGMLEGLGLWLLVRFSHIWLAIILAALIWWLGRQRLDSRNQTLLAIGLAAVVMVLALNQALIGQLLIIAAYAWWRNGQNSQNLSPRMVVWQAGWLQFMVLMAAFSAEAIWHWPVVIVLALIYGASLVIAGFFFAASERAGASLAAAWALIVAEAGYLFSLWLVNYILPHGLLIIPQAAVVLTALGYCFGSIYLAHAGARLSKARLAEYAVIGLCLIVIVIAGTRWSGSI